MKILKEFTSNRFLKKHHYNSVTYGLTIDYEIVCRFDDKCDDKGTWWKLSTNSLEELAMICDEFKSALKFKTFT